MSCGCADTVPPPGFHGGKKAKGTKGKGKPYKKTGGQPPQEENAAMAEAPFVSSARSSARGTSTRRSTRSSALSVSEMIVKRITEWAPKLDATYAKEIQWETMFKNYDDRKVVEYTSIMELLLDKGYDIEIAVQKKGEAQPLTLGRILNSTASIANVLNQLNVPLSELTIHVILYTNNTKSGTYIIDGESIHTNYKKSQTDSNTYHYRLAIKTMLIALKTPTSLNHQRLAHMWYMLKLIVGGEMLPLIRTHSKQHKTSNVKDLLEDIANIFGNMGLRNTTKLDDPNILYADIIDNVVDLFNTKAKEAAEESRMTKEKAILKRQRNSARAEKYEEQKKKRKEEMDINKLVASLGRTKLTARRKKGDPQKNPFGSFKFDSQTKFSQTPLSPAQVSELFEHRASSSTAYRPIRLSITPLNVRTRRRTEYGQDDDVAPAPMNVGDLESLLKDMKVTESPKPPRLEKEGGAKNTTEKKSQKKTTKNKKLT